MRLEYNNTGNHYPEPQSDTSGDYGYKDCTRCGEEYDSEYSTAEEYAKYCSVECEMFDPEQDG